VAALDGLQQDPPEADLRDRNLRPHHRHLRAREPGAAPQHGARLGREGVHGEAARREAVPQGEVSLALEAGSVTEGINMAIEWVRKLCMGLPHTTEEVLWGNDLVFKIGGKMYAVTPLDPAGLCLSFKVPEEEFAEL